MRVIGVHVRTSAESICPVQFLAAFPVLLPRECVQNGVAQVAQTVSCKCRSVQVLEHTFTVMNNEFLSPENWEMAVPTSGRLLLPAEHRSPHNPVVRAAAKLAPDIPAVSRTSMGNLSWPTIACRGILRRGAAGVMVLPCSLAARKPFGARPFHTPAATCAHSRSVQDSEHSEDTT